jgi:soluble lytic murein transglycosylase-like protein
MHNTRFRFVFLFLITAGIGAYNLNNPPLTSKLRSLPDSIERGLLSYFSAAQLHRRIFAAQTILMVDAMREADRKRLERAFQDGNAALPRARWRLALQPISLDVTIDGIGYRFWSDELILNRYRANHLNLFKAVSFVKRHEFYPWDLFQPIQYDQIPRHLAKFIVDLQTEHFRAYLRPNRWPDMGIDAWREIPDPIRKIAAYRMAWLWAVEYAPDGMRRGEAARLVAAIGRVESLFDIDKVVNRNPITGEEDLGFMQISSGLRQRLRRLPEFNEYNDEDFLKPWVSIQAGAYSLFCIFLPGSDGDVRKAIGHYNAGKNGPKQKASRYFELVIRKYRQAFIDRHYSPMLRLILERAEPGYFRDVRKDRLFREYQINGHALELN